jgi:nucleotide-binding universal stress UspA family protein
VTGAAAGRVLHATDFSRASTPAFDTAVEWARERGAELVIAHVVETSGVVLEDSYLSPKTLRDVQTGSRRQAEQRLGKLVEQARRAGVRASSLVLEGLAFEEIPAAADRLDADVIVMGTHGRTGLSRLLLGSVAERVVGLSRRPVLTVHQAGR